MASASKDAMEALHKVLADTLAQAITEGIPIVDKETGEVLKAPAPAAILSVARQFLKDNNIEALRVPGSPIAKLSTALPFAGTEDGDYEGLSLRH